MMIDFRVVVLQDATSTLSDEEHQASLNVLIQEFADILTVDEVLGELRANAS
jgi:isochorismate hydrolase